MAGIVVACLAILLIVVGIFRKSKTIRTIGLVCLIIPLILWGIIYFWYEVGVPKINLETKRNYSGVYEAVEPSKSHDSTKTKSVTFQLLLNDDGTFELDSVPGIGFSGKGKWETGGIDDQFMFYDTNKVLLGWTSPFGGDGNRRLIFNLYDSSEIRFLKKSINLEN